MFSMVVVPPTTNKEHHTVTQKYICVQIETYMHVYIDPPMNVWIKLENSTNLVAMNYENLKHVALLKNIDQKIWVETWKDELQMM